MTNLGPAPTIRQAKWDEAYRGVDYLNRVWARAFAKGQAEVQLKVPTPFVATIAEAILHMANNAMPLYRLHMAVEERSLSLLATTAQVEGVLQAAALRAGEAVSDLEMILDRRFKRPIPPRKRWPPDTGMLGFGC